jgi:hypothetical protein
MNSIGTRRPLRGLGLPVANADEQHAAGRGEIMNDSTRVARRPRRAWPRTVRTVATVIATAGLALLAAGCGGSSGSHVAQVGSTTTSSSSSPTPSAASAHGNDAVAFARCVRSKGVPNWPDPNSSGVFDKTKLTPQQLGVSSSKDHAAQSACSHLLPNGGSGPNAAQVQQIRALGLQFARCVRSHGVPNLPDPGRDGRIPDPASIGINQGSPKFKAANQACRKNRPPYMPSNSAYDAYAGTQG